MAKDDALEVTESFVGKIDKADVFFRKGDLVKADHPAVKKWPQFFGSALFRHEAAIEQATAAPGEKRSLAARLTGKDAEPEPTTGKAVTTTDLTPQPDKDK